MTPLASAVAVGFAAFLAAVAVVPLAVRSGERWRIVDWPDHRKTHPVPVPRTGGIAIAAGLLAGLLAAIVLDVVGTPSAAAWWAPVVAGTLIFAVGLVDDVRGVGVGVKLLVECLAALIVVSAAPELDTMLLPVGGPIELGFVGLVVAFVWLVGITNVVNLMDGLDGLAGGVATIVALSFMGLTFVQGDPASMAAAAAIAGACLGFLRSNWSPAAVFLGDAGALTIGFALAYLGLIASLKASTAVAVAVPLLAMGVPAVDMLLVMTSRFLGLRRASIRNRIGRVFQADRLHLHHVVQRLIPDTRRVAVVLYAIVAIFCVLGLVAVARNSLTLAGVSLIMEAVVVILIRRFGGVRSPDGE